MISSTLPSVRRFDVAAFVGLVSLMSACSASAADEGGASHSTTQSTTDDAPLARSGVIHLRVDAVDGDPTRVDVRLSGTFTAEGDAAVLEPETVFAEGGCRLLKTVLPAPPGYAGEHLLLLQNATPAGDSNRLIRAPQNGPGRFLDIASFDLDGLRAGGALALALEDSPFGAVTPVVVERPPGRPDVATFVRGEDFALPGDAAANAAHFVDFDSGVAVRCDAESDGAAIRLPASLTARFLGPEVTVYSLHRREHTTTAEGRSLKVVVSSWGLPAIVPAR